VSGGYRIPDVGTLHRVPRLRTSSEDQVEVAVEELVNVASEVRGLDIERDHGDWLNVTVGAESWLAQVLVRDAVSQSVARHLMTAEAGSSKIVVANQLSADAKDELDRANRTSHSYGWSWFDRRGELQLNHPTATAVYRFDQGALEHRSQLPGGWRLSAPASDGPIRGRAGISYAAAVLLDPTRKPSIREVAHAVGMSHGAVGDAAKLLRGSGLIRPSREPEVPALFSALAAVWGPTRITPVAAVPTHDQAKRWQAHADDLAQPGWALGGDEAAGAWGAPVFASGGRPWIWVPTEADARRAERALTAAAWDDHAAVVAVPPTLLVCRHRLMPPAMIEPSFLPTTHPLFLALELSQDPARGREILDEWTPDDPEIHRVW
jgi:hypothetical protein